ncbi:TMEM175 family protein [Streptomyces sp. NPDC054765]
MRQLHGIDVERMRAFADAVFAIAITLLALEMTVPEGLPSRELGHALEKALPTVAGYALSFIVVGALWLSHHRLFGMVKVLDGSLLYLDMAFLGIVAALPFPTKLISGYHGSAIATSVYAMTICIAACLITAMSLLLRGRPELRKNDISRELVTGSMMSSATVAAVFATSVPLALVSPSLTEYWWILVVPIRRWLSRRPQPVTEPAP